MLLAGSKLVSVVYMSVLRTNLLVISSPVEGRAPPKLYCVNTYYYRSLLACDQERGGGIKKTKNNSAFKYCIFCLEIFQYVSIILRYKINILFIFFILVV